MSNMSKKEMKKAEAAIRAIAAENGITEEEVRKEMSIGDYFRFCVNLQTGVE